MADHPKIKPSPLHYNRCGVCGKFKPWDRLRVHFTPDTTFSSEEESWQECWDCMGIDVRQSEARDAAR